MGWNPPVAIPAHFCTIHELPIILGQSVQFRIIQRLHVLVGKCII
jgi:hypothetical protein